ncbi:MAG: hypothetical protein EOO51_01255 [Flavobacterium sp.]|nr:MAG: hypothetical protein EOO51_01255 [Flavobacterium sp.]
MIDYTEINDLTRNPLLRELLTKYCLAEYEDAAIIDDDHLMMEYNKLKNDNELHKLFLQEQMDNYFEEQAEV